MRIVFVVLLFAANVCAAQQSDAPKMQVPKVVPIPELHPAAPVSEPTSPAARDVVDGRDHLKFHLPAGWNLSRKDGEVSSFRMDARNVPKRVQLRLTASLAFNPYPQSTFSGATFYVSVTPGMTAAGCAAQTTTNPFSGLPDATIDSIQFARGKDEHGKICTEARDVVYTTLRGGSCLRFDLAINSFCGGDVSGAQDLTVSQLQGIYTRLAGIVDSVRFTR